MGPSLRHSDPPRADGQGARLARKIAEAGHLGIGRSQSEQFQPERVQPQQGEGRERVRFTRWGHQWAFGDLWEVYYDRRV